MHRANISQIGIGLIIYRHVDPAQRAAAEFRFADFVHDLMDVLAGFFLCHFPPLPAEIFCECDSLLLILILFCILVAHDSATLDEFAAKTVRQAPLFHHVLDFHL